MPSVLPHNTAFRKMVRAYLDETSGAIRNHVESLNGLAEYRNIYRITWATDHVYSGLGTESNRPKVDVARDILRRVPLLVAVAQLSVATIELRRFVEVLFWVLYFSEHPVEWSSFKRYPNRSYEQDKGDPISYGAHRELGFYINYAREFRVCSGLTTSSGGRHATIPGCKITSCIGASSESRLPGRWTRWT